MHLVVRRAARGAASLAVLVALVAGARAPLAVAQDMSGAGPANVAAAEPVLVREQPGYDAPALATIGPGEPIEVIGGETWDAAGNAWVPVVAGGQSGYLPAYAVGGTATAAQPIAESAPAEEVLADPVATDAMAAPVEPAAEAAPVEAAPVDPATDYAVDPAAEPLAEPAYEPEAEPVYEPAAAPDPAMAAPAVGSAATTTDVNLRTGPSYDAPVLAVLPPGAPVAIDGDAVSGFFPVTAEGFSGWIDAQYLGDPGAPLAAPAPEAAPAADAAAGTEDDAAAAPALPDPVASESAAAPAPPTDNPSPRQRDSAGIIWPFAGGTWQVIQGYNNGTHTNRSGFAQYKYALDWARTDGKTAGQDVYAPVSGTVEWTDRGSGGLLINMGDGYGVALFHVTLDGGLRGGSTVERGQRLGVVSGPGGDGYMSTAHVDMTLWKLTGGRGGHEAAPWVGPHAIAGQEFPDAGGGNQYMGFEIRP